MCQSEYGSNELCVKMKTMFQGIQRLCRIKKKIVGGGGGGGHHFLWISKISRTLIQSSTNIKFQVTYMSRGECGKDSISFFIYYHLPPPFTFTLRYVSNLGIIHISGRPTIAVVKLSPHTSMTQDRYPPSICEMLWGFLTIYYLGAYLTCKSNFL